MITLGNKSCSNKPWPSKILIFLSLLKGKSAQNRSIFLGQGLHFVKKLHKLTFQQNYFFIILSLPCLCLVVIVLSQSFPCLIPVLSYPPPPLHWTKCCLPVIPSPPETWSSTLKPWVLLLLSSLWIFYKLYLRCIVISIFFHHQELIIMKNWSTFIYINCWEIFPTLFFLHKMSDMLDIDYIGYRIPNIIDIEEI